MTRSAARELAVHFVYELGFADTTAAGLLESGMKRPVFERLATEEELYAQFPNLEQRAYIAALVEGVEAHRAELEEYISRFAIGWKLNRLPRMTVAILEVCMFEILYMGDVPNAAAINEAVELTKRYEDEELSAFVNGILGSFVRSEPQPQGEGAIPPDPAAFEESGEEAP